MMGLGPDPIFVVIQQKIIDYTFFENNKAKNQTVVTQNNKRFFKFTFSAKVEQSEILLGWG